MPRSTVKRDPESFAPLSKSSQPRLSPSSQCSFGVKSNLVGSSTVFMHTLSSSSLPNGTSSSVIFGTLNEICSSFSSYCLTISSASARAALFKFSSFFSSLTSSPALAFTPSSLLFAFWIAWKFSSALRFCFSSLKVCKSSSSRLALTFLPSSFFTNSS